MIDVNNMIDVNSVINVNGGNEMTKKPNGNDAIKGTEEDRREHATISRGLKKISQTDKNIIYGIGENSRNNRKYTNAITDIIIDGVSIHILLSVYRILNTDKFKKINMLLHKYTDYDVLIVQIYLLFKNDLPDNYIDISKLPEQEINTQLFKCIKIFVCDLLEEKDLTEEEKSIVQRARKFRYTEEITEKIEQVQGGEPSTDKEIIKQLYMVNTCDGVISDFHGTGKKQFKEKTMANQATAKKKNVSIIIDNYIDEALKTNKDLKVPTHKLMVVLNKKLNENNQYKETDVKKIETIVTFTMSEYMEACGVKNEKEARKTMVRELNTLYNVSLDFTADTTENGKRIKNNNFLNVRICTHKGIKNGVVTYGYSPVYAKHVINAPITKIPSKLLLINSNINPHAYHLGLKLTYYYNMNEDKPNSNIISVKALTEYCPDLPTYEHVKSTGRRYKQQIVTPFEKDMDALQEMDILTWEYCNSKYEPLTDYQAENTDNYEIFKTLFIKFKLYDYPEGKKKPKAIKGKKK